MAESPRRCIQCGAEDVAGTWYAAVAAESCWVCGKNVPTPVAPVWATDATEVWDLPLCTKCLGRDYVAQLREAERREARLLRWMSAIFAFFVVVRLGLAFLDRSGAAGHWLAIVSDALLFAAGVAVALKLYRYVQSRCRRRAGASAAPLTTGNLADGVEAETERLLTARKGGEAEAAQGLALPAFASKPTDEIEQRLGACYLKEQRRRVVAVAPTREELERKLADETRA